MVEEKEPKLKKDERFCFKCKRVVNKSVFNNYFEICHECEEKSGH